jgi:NADPH2:quinone reductase
MRAVVVRELSGPDGAAFVEVPEPEGSHWLTPGERLLIDVHAAAICFPDLLQTRGLYQHSVPPPFISGGEVGGVVIEAPEGSPFAPGDRVCGVVRRGAMAERALAPPPFVLRLPDHMSYAQGAALYINYTTAWFGLHRAGVRPGETVLLQGAAGGVGTAAIEVAKAFGARTVSVVSSDAKEAAVRALGTDAVVRADGAEALRIMERREAIGKIVVDVR